MSVFLRVCAALIGVVGIGLTVWIVISEGYESEMISIFFFCAVFIAYGLFGNEGFSKSRWLNGYAKKIGKKDKE